MPASSRIGVLVVNLGTPDSPDTAAVRRYLAEFLSDPRVLDINPIGRWLLLHGIILRTRPAKSAEAYKKVWTDEGSPLLVHGQALVASLKEKLDAEVVLAMRYGSPSIDAGLEALDAAGCDRIVVFPLYPQHASSSTGSTIEHVLGRVAARWKPPAIFIVPSFPDHPAYIDAQTAIAQPVLAAFKPDHILLSYHGLPERHMRKGDLTGSHCLSDATCCERAGAAQSLCYRAQCLRTSKALAAALGWADDYWTMGFQSRLGRTPWIQPFTDQLLVELAESGVKRLAVFSPAFVADCLETLEEIGMRADADFRAAGGEALTLIPSLNAHPKWVDGAARLIKEAAPGPL